MKIGEIIKKERIAKNVTMQELADACGLSRLTIANIERTRFDTLFINVVNIANYLKIPLDELAETVKK